MQLCAMVGIKLGGELKLLIFKIKNQNFVLNKKFDVRNKKNKNLNGWGIETLDI